jgi:Family of unknown function (DUF6448)
MTKRTMLLAAATLLLPLTARAHCDTMDGPVVKTARAALDANDVSPVLAWVKPADEPEIRAAFRKAIDARRTRRASHEPSDRPFLETVVRVHRAGEGAPYIGLKAAGATLTAAVRAADVAVEAKDGSPVEQILVDAVASGLRRRFAAPSALESPGSDVAAGRRWVDAYVEYVHYVERLESAAGEASALPTPAERSRSRRSSRGTCPSSSSTDRGAVRRWRCSGHETSPRGSSSSGRRVCSSWRSSCRSCAGCSGSAP